MPEVIATYADSWFFLFLIPEAQAPPQCVTCYVLVHKLHYVTWNFVCGECIYVLYPWNWCFLFRGHEDEMFQVFLIWMKHLWMQLFSLFSFSGVFFTIFEPRADWFGAEDDLFLTFWYTCSVSPELTKDPKLCCTNSVSPLLGLGALLHFFSSNFYVDINWCHI